MGRYRQDLELIAGLLGSGMAGDQGLGMLMEAKAAQDVRKQEKKSALNQLVSGATSMAADPNVDLNAITNQIQSIAPTMGYGQKFANKAVKRIAPLYDRYGAENPSILAATWDQQDEATVAELVAAKMQEAPDFKNDRATLRFAVKEELRKNMGDELLTDLNDNIDDAINNAFIQAGGIPRDESNGVDAYTAAAAAKAGVDPQEYIQAQEDAAGMAEGWLGRANTQAQGQDTFANVADWIDDNLLFGLVDSGTKFFHGDQEKGELWGDEHANLKGLGSMAADAGQVALGEIGGLIGGKVAGAVARPVANQLGRVIPGLDSFVARGAPQGEEAATAFASQYTGRGGQPLLGNFVRDMRAAGRTGGMNVGFPGMNLHRGMAASRSGGLNGLVPEDPIAAQFAGGMDDIMPNTGWSPDDGARINLADEVAPVTANIDAPLTDDQMFEVITKHLGPLNIPGVDAGRVLSELPPQATERQVLEYLASLMGSGGRPLGSTVAAPLEASYPSLQPTSPVGSSNTGYSIDDAMEEAFGSSLTRDMDPLLGLPGRPVPARSSLDEALNPHGYHGPQGDAEKLGLGFETDLDAIRSAAMNRGTTGFAEGAVDDIAPVNVSDKWIEPPYRSPADPRYVRANQNVTAWEDELAASGVQRGWTTPLSEEASEVGLNALVPRTGQVADNALLDRVYQLVESGQIGADEATRIYNLLRDKYGYGAIQSRRGLDDLAIGEDKETAMLELALKWAREGR